MKLKLTLLGLIFSVNAFAWEQVLLNQAESYDYPTANPFYASLLGFCKVPKAKIDKSNWTYRRQEVDTKATRSGVIPYDIALHKSKRLPVLVILPGIFSKLNTPWVSRLPRLLSQQGYNAISFANPFSTSLLKEEPHFRLMDVHQEAQAYYLAIRKIVKNYQAKGNFSQEVRLLGVSYGAFLLSIMTALDADHNDPIFTKGDITLIAPPKNLWKTIQNLDELMATESSQELEKSSMLSLYLKIAPFCLRSPEKELSEKQRFKVTGLVSHLAIKRPLLAVLKDYAKLRDDFEYPSRWKVLARKRFEREIKLTRFVDRYLKDVGEKLRTKEGDLLYWLNRSQIKYRILTSQDDFLNKKEEWEGVPHTLILPRGGHYGYRSLPWFESFLSLAFKGKP